MKQKLSLLLLAVLWLTRALATDVTLVDGTNDPYDYYGTRNTSVSPQTLTSNATSGMAGVVLSAPIIDRATWWSTRCLSIKSSAPQTDEAITITAPAGYYIASLSMTVQAYSSNMPYQITLGDNTQTITGASAYTFTMSEGTEQSVSFTIRSTASSVNWLAVKALTMSVMEAGAKTVNVTYNLYHAKDMSTVVATQTVTQEAGSEVVVPSSMKSGYSSMCYDIVTEGEIGDEDCTVNVIITPKEGLVESLAELSNAKTYTIMSERGTFTTNDGKLANTVKNSSYPVNYFALVLCEGNYYMWSEAENKFVSCSGNALGDMPVAVTMTSVASGLFKFSGGGLTMNSTSGFATGGGFDSWTTTDEGNRCAIFAVADFDATDVLEAISVMLSSKTIKLAVNVTGTTEAENTRAGKLTMVLNDGSTYSKYVNADTETEELQYRDATFTLTATSYRGYEFTGFTIGDQDFGTSIEAGELSEVAEGSTIVANYTASTGNGLNLWFDYSDDGKEAYRLPAIVRTQGGRIIAFADYRPGNTDVGIGPTSIERRYSDDGGKTWSTALRVAQGNWGENTENVIEWSFGDAAAVADQTPGNSGNDVLMICCGGNARWTSSSYNADTSVQQQGVVRWRSTDGGATWSTYEYIMPDLMKTFEAAGLRAEDGSSGIVRAFFSSGKMKQSARKAEGAKYNRIYNAVNVNTGNVVMYSDDFGQTWQVLGGDVANNGDEAHVVELPDGDILLVGKGSSSRYVNVFNYSDFNAGEGVWGTKNQWNNAAATSCHGDVEVLEAYDAYGEKNTVVVETAPMTASPQRRELQYYFIALKKSEGFSTDDFSVQGGASWTQGMNITHNWGAYSSLLPNGDGTFDIFFEECTTGETLRPTGYNMVYLQGHAINDITLSQYFYDKDQAEAEGVKLPSVGHFYRFKGSASEAYLTAGAGILTTKAAADASNIWYLSPEGLVSYSTGLCLNGAVKGLASIGETYKAAISPSTYYDGKYTIRTNNIYTYDKDSNNTIDRGTSFNNDVRYAWIVEEVTTLPVEVSELGLATLYSPVSLTLPDGVTAYAAKENPDYGTIHFDAVAAIKAETGVLLEAEPGTHELTVAASDADYESDLLGSVLTQNATLSSHKIYTLQSGPAFRLYNGSQLTGFRSHIQSAASADVKAFDIIFGDATGIGNISQSLSTTDQDAAVYNVAGQRLSKPMKGINIVNNKKILK